ncbi:glycosyl hydrolase 53 family protein [Microbacterium sp. JZ70]
MTVPNGGFEEFTTADSWVAADWNMTTTVWVTDAAAHSGTYSQGLNQWNDAATLSQTLTAPEGSYDVSLFVWANDSLGDSRLVANGASVPIASGGATQIDGTKTWDEIRVEDVPVGADGQLEIQIVVPELTSSTLTGFIDDVTVEPATDGPGEPEPAESFLTEPGFEDGGAAWDIGGELLDSGRSGSAHAVQHSEAGGHETSQVVDGLADGYYRLTAWVQNDGGFDEAYIFAAGGGDSDAKTAIPRTNFAYDEAGTWKRTTLRGVHVTSGQVEVGLRTLGSDAGSVRIDDLALVRDDDPYEMLVGGDISALTYTEDLGGRYSDAAGRETDPLQILADSGWNIVRIRVYNDPGKGRGDGGYYVPEGYVDTEDALALSQRAKAAGLQIQLSLHYSDYWTNPGLQKIPHEWQSLIDGKTDAEAVDILETQVHDFTSDVLQQMNDQGTTPEYVSLGNETRSGMLFPYGSLANWDNLGRFYNAGAAAVREKAPDSKIIIHLDDGGNTATYQSYFSNAAAQNVDYDIIGTSFYPYWTNKSAPRFAEFANTITQQFDKPMMIMETGFNYQDEKGAGGPGQLEHIGPYGEPSDASPELQRDFMIELFNEMQGVAGGKVIGDLYWDPIQTYAGGQTGWAYFESTDRADINAIDNTTLFDLEGKALPVLDAYRLNTRGADTSTVAGTVTDDAGLPVTGATVTLATPGSDARTAMTNEYGDYYFARAATGSHTVTAEKSGLGAPEAATVSVTAGARADLDVVLSGTQPLRAVSGTITGSGGEKIVGALIRITGNGYASSRLAGADGVFRFPTVADGTYTMKVTQDGYVASTTQLTVSGSNVTASVQLIEDVGTVTGTVVGTDGQPLSGAAVRIGEAETTTGSDGAFTIAGVPSGQGLVVTAAQVGYLDSFSAPITVVHSQTTSGVRIELPVAVPVVNGSFETAGADGDASAEGWTLTSEPAGAVIRQDRRPFQGTVDGSYAVSFWAASAYTAAPCRRSRSRSPAPTRCARIRTRASQER